MGMMPARALVIAVVVTMSLAPLVSMAFAADNVTVHVSMLDGQELSRFNKPLLVSGIWHFVNLTFDQDIDQFTVKLFKGDTAPAERNETNYYAWEYDEAAPQSFADISGYGSSFLNRNSTRKGNVYSFVIGVADTLPNIVKYCENWTLEVASSNGQLYSGRIVIEKLSTGISMSKPTSISFKVEPFTVMDAQGNTFFKIGNKGNIPVFIAMDYAQYQNVIEISDFNKNLSVNEDTTYYITVHSKSWQPQIMELTIQGIGSYPRSFFIDTNATIVLYSSFIIDIPTLVITVGHSNYTINELPGTQITFQHLDQVRMAEGEEKDIDAYVSGSGTVELEVQADGQNVRLIKLFDNNLEKSSPLSFISSNTSERKITARIRAISEGTTGTITYTLTSDGSTQTYTTRIIIGPPTSIKPTASLNLDIVGRIAVILLVLFVVVYMIIVYVKHKRR
jgi:hypothetical protein